MNRRMKMKRMKQKIEELKQLKCGIPGPIITKHQDRHIFTLGCQLVVPEYPVDQGLSASIERYFAQEFANKIIPFIDISVVDDEAALLCGHVKYRAELKVVK